MRHFALILLIPMALFAQGRAGVTGAGVAAPGGRQAVMPPPPPPTPTADLATIEGSVVNAVSGTPLRKANIMMNRMSNGPMAQGARGNYSASTDTSGRFTITGVEPGTYRLSASHTGYLQGQYSARRPGSSFTPVDLAKAQKMTSVVIKLIPHGVISGKVTDEDGDPLEGADVQVMRYAYNQGKKQLQGNGGSNTNDLGEYRISGIAPGKYFLVANYRNRRNMMIDMGVAGPQDAPQEDYISTYYAGATDIAAAAPVDLSPGDQVQGINIRMSRTRTVQVRGRVIDNVEPSAPPPPPPDVAGRGGPINVNVLNGQIVANVNNVMNNMRVQVHLQPRNSMGPQGMMSTTQVKPDGTFEFASVPPGPYYVVAMTQRGAKGHAVREPIDVGNNNLENITLAINPGVSVVGHIRYDGQPPQPLPSLSVRLTPRENTLGMGVPQPAKVDADGSFRFDDVNPDQYNVNVNVPQGLYVKSMRAGNSDALISGLDLSNGAGSVDILFGTNPPQVTGSVLNSSTQQPAASVTVVLIPQEKERQNQSYFYSTSNTDQYGNFTFNRVTPGQYKVYAWEDVQFGQWFDPDFMKLYETKGEPASAQEGSPVNLKLVMIPAQ